MEIKKKMKTRLFVTMATVALMAAGCSNDENEGTDSNWNGEILLSSGVTVQTRAANTPPDTQIGNGQKVGVFINDAITSTAIGTNLQYDADGGGNLALATTDPAQKQPYYPATGNAVNIIAYQPYNAGALLTDGGYEFAVQTDQSQQSGYYNSDLLYSAKADAYTRQKAAQSLGFVHKLSKVVCTLTSGVGAPTVTGATVSIVNAETKVTFKPADGNLTAATTNGSKSDITMNSTIATGSYIAVIPPQTFEKNAQFLKVTLSATAGGGVFYYKIPNGSGDAPLSLVSGNVYTYDITEHLTKLTVTSSIEPWEGIEGNKKSGDAIMGE